MKQKQLFITGTALALAAALAGCGAAAPAADQTQARQPSYISMTQAQTAALDAANIEAADADISSSTLDEVAGVSCYKVEFTAGGRAYDYSINAETGEVLEMSVRDETAALADAPQTDVPVSGTATVTKSKLDYDDGRQVYEIEFYVSGSSGYTEHDYEIEAATGKIVSYDHDAESYAPPAQSTNSGVKVTEATAKKTALSRVSGATEKDIYEWKLDYDDGRTEYEGKIIYGGMEYEFTINAATGAVTEWDVECVYD